MSADADETGARHTCADCGIPCGTEQVCAPCRNRRWARHNAGFGSEAALTAAQARALERVDL